MKVNDFVDILGCDFFTGVPDSLLKPLNNYLMATYGENPRHHIIAANEGNAAAIAAGYHLGTGKVAAVYLQNSGEGNLVNPYASLLHAKVYAIPEIFVIGWRGEPGKKDEPQHIFQGEITLSLLDLLEIPYCLVREETTAEELREARTRFSSFLRDGRDVAFVVTKGALTDAPAVHYQNAYPLRREEILRHILAVSGDSPIVSTTGKASRELYELREARGEGHERDFLTVGSMGHSSSIALGLALTHPEKTVYAIDGDGAALMHMGAMAVIGKAHPENLIHIVINNEAHESVGGLPTAAGHADLAAIARACGYDEVTEVRDADALDRALTRMQESHGLRFLLVRAAIGARDDLGRPKETPQQNKRAFMEELE